MKLQEIELSKLNPAAYNPRVNLEPGMEEYEKLKKSIKTFGDVEPIVWNKRTGNVVGGHQRLQVLKDLGAKKAKVSVVDLDEKQEKRLNLALNKAKGEWDIEKLNKLLSGITEDNLELTGFRADELAILLASNEGIEDVDWGADEQDEDVPLYGASWIVTVKCRDIQQARQWCDKEGLDAVCKDGTRTTVIRFDEGDV